MQLILAPEGFEDGLREFLVVAVEPRCTPDHFLEPVAGISDLRSWIGWLSLVTPPLEQFSMRSFTPRSWSLSGLAVAVCPEYLPSESVGHITHKFGFHSPYKQKYISEDLVVP